MAIYLARHGQTDWNALGKLQGATDVPLNEVGREQATALGKLLAHVGIARVVASTLSRARQTGELAAQALGLGDVQMTDADLRERSFGVFEGLTRDECATQHAEAWADWQARRIAPPSAEPTEEVVTRMTRGLERIATSWPNDAVLAVSHGGAMRLALSALTGEDLPLIANGAIYVVERTARGWQVDAWTSPAR